MTRAERPFVDGPAGPRATTDPVAVAATRFWGLPEPVWLRTGMNAIYRAGDVIVRVGAATAPAESSLALASMLRGVGLGVPMPMREDVVELDGLSATAWERLVPVDIPIDWHRVGAMIGRVHRLDERDLPAAYPCPPAASFPWWNFDQLRAEVGDDLDARAQAGLDDAIARHRWWTQAPDPQVICHGDVHPGNVMMTASGAVVLDWDLLCRAPAGWDHAMLIRAARWTYPDTWYDEFAAGYGWDGRSDPLTLASAELRLVAATLMRVRAARADAGARPEAERRLRYWRGEHDAPVWHPV